MTDTPGETIETSSPSTFEIGLMVINLILSIILVVMFVNIAVRLIVSGEQLLGIAVALIGSTSTLISPSLKLLQEQFDQTPIRRGIKASGVRIILLIVVFFGQQFLFDTIAKKRIAVGLQEDNLLVSETALLEAQNLSYDVVPEIEGLLMTRLSQRDWGIQTQSPIYLAQLYLLFADPTTERYTNLTVELRERTCQAFIENRTLIGQQLLEVLAIISLETAEDVAADMNDASTYILADTVVTTQPQVCKEIFESIYMNASHAKVYLEALKLFDDTFETHRSSGQQSVSRYNLAILREREAFAPDFHHLVVSAYEEALALNPNNTLARYRLVSFWLKHIQRFDNVGEVLDRAVLIAHEGWSDINNQAYPRCEAVDEMADMDSIIDSYLCFLMMTVEAGARLQRIEHNVATVDDAPETIEALLDRAIRLAEDSKHFIDNQQTPTAEAYYYRARLHGPNASDEDLQNIITYHNRESTQQRAWAQYANTMELKDAAIKEDMPK